MSGYDASVLVVTTESLPGYRVTSILGEVLGVTACSRNPFRAGLRTPDGGAGMEMSHFLLQTRSRALAAMVHVAEQRGANAVIGMRFDHRDITGSWIELCAYGTAVIAIPIRGPREAPTVGRGV
jgi:uncharacterized protein YbjQ (UPF0145 family)